MAQPKIIEEIKGLKEDATSHMNDSMPHQFKDGAKTYRYGLSVVSGVVTMNYEEVI